MKRKKKTLSMNSTSVQLMNHTLFTAVLFKRFKLFCCNNPLGSMPWMWVFYKGHKSSFFYNADWCLR